MKPSYLINTTSVKIREDNKNRIPSVYYLFKEQCWILTIQKKENGIALFTDKSSQWKHFSTLINTNLLTFPNHNE